MRTRYVKKLRCLSQLVKDNMLQASILGSFQGFTWAFPMCLFLVVSQTYEAQHVDATSSQAAQPFFGDHKQILFDGLQKWVTTVRKVYHRTQETALRVIYKTKGQLSFIDIPWSILCASPGNVALAEQLLRNNREAQSGRVAKDMQQTPTIPEDDDLTQTDDH